MVGQAADRKRGVRRSRSPFFSRFEEEPSWALRAGGDPTLVGGTNSTGGINCQASYRARLPKPCVVVRRRRSAARLVRERARGQQRNRCYAMVASRAVAGSACGWNVVPSRQSANRIPASRRARPTTATYLPRRLATVAVQRCSGSASLVDRDRSTAHAACTSSRRMRVPPCLAWISRRPERSAVVVAGV